MLRPFGAKRVCVLAASAMFVVLMPHLRTVAGEMQIGAPDSRTSTQDGDRAWARRAETLDGRLADAARIDEAIGHYRRAVSRDPSAIAPRWKLIRALHYSIEFSTIGDDEKEARASEIVELARESVEVLESMGSVDDADRARLLFWTAIAWGTRAQRVGLLTIVTEGLASRMHEFAQASLALDPSVDQGGALRLLSRLHATLPRVPFVSGWVDRDRALPLAERGYALAPRHPGNRLILALALEEGGTENAERVRALLESVVRAMPRPEYRAEDEAIREQARERLATRSRGRE